MLVLQRRNPFAECGGDFIGIAATQLAACAIAAAVFVQLQVFQQHGNRRACDVRGLHQRAAGIGDAIHSAVHVVAVRVARIVLHVANENVLPIDDIERAVGCKFKIDRAES